MTIRMSNHKKLYELQKAEFDRAVLGVLENGFDGEAEIGAFEREFANWNGASYAVTVNSGTASIRIALLALGVGHGDEVITVPNTDICTTSAIRQTGAHAVWVDVDPVTRTMSIDALQTAITPRTRAIVPVDMFGHPAEIPTILDIARRCNLAVVEDACLALGATIDARKVGSFATATCFSFGQKKHLGSFGSGGCILTEDAELAERMRKLSGYGEARSYSKNKVSLGKEAFFWHETEGLNERLHEIQAAILRVKLRSLDQNLATRRRQAATYSSLLDGLPLSLPQCRPNIEHAWRNYVVEADDRDRIRETLAALGVQTNLSYTPPMHLQPVYAYLDRGPGSYPIAERICSRLFGLPIGPHLSDDEQDSVIEALRKVLQ